MLSTWCGDVVGERSRDGGDAGDDERDGGDDVAAVSFAPGRFAAVDVAVPLA
jgi:hypothetical protein